MEWISVKDRLPKLDDWERGELLPVIVYMDNMVQALFWDLDDECFWDDGLPAKNVTHWMPLPPPPKE